MIEKTNTGWAEWRGSDDFVDITDRLIAKDHPLAYGLVGRWKWLSEDEVKQEFVKSSESPDPTLNWFGQRHDQRAAFKAKHEDEAEAEADEPIIVEA